MENGTTVGAMKTINGFVYFTGSIAMISSQLAVTEPKASIEVAPFTQNDFEQALKKVSRKHSLPVGENIRDAIRSIKRK